MQCPKCYSEMEVVSQNTEGSVRVDRCSECKGLFFDQMTKRDLALVEKSAAYDSGDEVLGAEYDEMVYVDCPKCDKMMDQQKVDDPVRIRFELCPTCNSAFLDAGEFRRYLQPEYRVEFEALLPE